jgi:UDP-3-O-[3-hydroxymyristoyl] N-acetylglucosamine deacetylase
MTSTPRQVVVRGVGLHTGTPASVTLRARPGAVELCSGGRAARIADLEVASTERSTTVEAYGGLLRVGTVEHVFAALAGCGVYDGVELDIDGPEMPLLDGGAGAWCDALAALELPGPGRRAPGMRVARDATVHLGASRYEFTRGPGVEVEARLELDDARLEPEARWTGGPDDFRARIAPARTFARASDVEDLLRRGLARHVDAASVVVLAAGAIHHSGPAFSPDEPARHKLLDLIGDLYVHGGPPIGRVRGVRPGHSANAEAMRRALDDGILVLA